LRAGIDADLWRALGADFAQRRAGAGEPGDCDSHVGVGGERVVDELVQHRIAVQAPPIACRGRGGIDAALAGGKERAGCRQRGNGGDGIRPYRAARNKREHGCGGDQGADDRHGLFLFCGLQGLARVRRPGGAGQSGRQAHGRPRRKRG
jgi:hypothetical protein